MLTNRPQTVPLLTDPYARLAAIVAAMEAALRRSGYWEKQEPPAPALASVQPFCVDTLPFTTWLQWVFIPRVRRLIQRREQFPLHSDILPYARECLYAPGPGTNHILETVRAFDTLINDTARRNATRH